jgi:hypothetical protein
MDWESNKPLMRNVTHGILTVTLRITEETTMPTPRQHTDNAAKQRAYRKRQATARTAELQAKGLPNTAPIPTMPSEARWTAATTHAYETLNTVLAERQAYYNERSEQWQESDKGDEFQRRIDALESIVSDLAEW